jgi:hypothetical protein
MLGFVIFTYWLIGVGHGLHAVKTSEPGNRVNAVTLAYNVFCWPHILYQKYVATK